MHDLAVRFSQPLLAAPSLRLLIAPSRSRTAASVRAAYPAPSHRPARRPHSGHSRRPCAQPCASSASASPRSTANRSTASTTPVCLRRPPMPSSPLPPLPSPCCRSTRSPGPRSSWPTAMWMLPARCTATSRCSASAIPPSARASIPMSSPARAPQQPPYRKPSFDAEPAQRSLRRTPSPWPFSICSPSRSSNQACAPSMATVIGDDTFFLDEPLAQGWAWNDLQWSYGAPVSALTFNDNADELTITADPSRPAQLTAHGRPTSITTRSTTT